MWDSLAICEYLAERHPERRLWPSDAGERAMARAISAEMHSGFQHLRSNMSMNCRRQLPGLGRTVEVAGEIDRVQRLWGECRARHAANGPFLFGTFTIADAMYAPVVLRFRTYAVQLNPPYRARTPMQSCRCPRSSSGLPRRKPRQRPLPHSSRKWRSALADSPRG